MNQVTEFFKKLLDTSDWPPRWHCGKWSDFHGWFYIISDLLIWSAYFAIPLMIVKYISKRKDVRFHKIYFLFAAFILACGSTHFLDAVAFWFPAYRLNALVRFITGVISWVTVFHLVQLLPVAFSLKSSGELEAEVERRKKIESIFRLKNDQLMEAQDIAKLGNWEWDVIKNKITWSEGLYNMFGLQTSKKDISYDFFLSRIHPEDRKYVEATINNALQAKDFNEYYHKIIMPDGSVKTMHARGEIVVNGENEVVKMIGTVQDVTAQKNVEQELLSKTHQLEIVNDELQKFAYVASHDLQEPLRKIITFTSLLNKEIEGNLSEKGKVYFDKIIKSSLRMQGLIDDVLDLSRLTGNEVAFSTVNVNAVIEQVLSDMEITIQSSNAVIKVDNLPTLEANGTQLSQLFQNLISNAIKFHHENVVPNIHIYANIINGTMLPGDFQEAYKQRFSVIGNSYYMENEQFCDIYVSDNGIGFDESYLDRLFVIFQRLHSRAAFDGTGIGLAICKRIVDNHHGYISAKSIAEKGSVFNIILPVLQRT